METVGEWKQDRLFVSAARSAFSAGIRCALMSADAAEFDNDKVMPYLRKVEEMANEFEDEPEYMGAGVASLWQDRALELSRPAISHPVDPRHKLLNEAALQLAALVYQLAKRQGGERSARGFGYAFVFVRMDVRDGAVQVDPELDGVTFDPRAMMEFVYLHALQLGVPAAELAAKKDRRGL